MEGAVHPNGWIYGPPSKNMGRESLRPRSPSPAWSIADYDAPTATRPSQDAAMILLAFAACRR